MTSEEADDVCCIILQSGIVSEDDVLISVARLCISGTATTFTVVQLWWLWYNGAFMVAMIYWCSYGDYESMI